MLGQGRSVTLPSLMVPGNERPRYPRPRRIPLSVKCPMARWTAARATPSSRADACRAGSIVPTGQRPWLILDHHVPHDSHIGGTLPLARVLYTCRVVGPFLGAVSPQAVLGTTVSL
jgi:hypothetical protein